MRFKERRKSHRLREISSHKEVHNNWEISYGDMITLLLGFFVLFFNIKTDKIDLKVILKNLEKEFQTLQQPQEVKNQKINIPAFKEDYKVMANMSGEKLLVEFPGVSFFEAGSTSLTKEGQKALEQFSQTMKDKKGLFRYVVRGYTDNTKFYNPTAKYKDNLELSTFRSLSAIRYMNKNGIDLKFLRVAGYGETDLSDRRTPAEQRVFDRKVAIVIEPIDESERNFEDLEKPSRIEKKEKINRAKQDTATWINPVTELLEYAKSLLIKDQESEIKIVWIDPVSELLEKYKNANIATKEDQILETENKLKKSSPEVKKIDPAPKLTDKDQLRAPASQFENPEKTNDEFKKIKDYIHSNWLYKKINPYHRSDK